VKAHWSQETPQILKSRFNFSTHGREFSVYVETHPSLFHPDHHLTVVKGGREEVREVDTRRIVLGQIEGEKGSVVHGVIVDGVLEGVIYSRGETYHLEPAHRYVRQVPLHYSSICTPTCTTYYMLQISREGCGWRW
jgi:hypothetical protein